MVKSDFGKRQIEALMYCVHYFVVLKYFGQLAFIMALLSSVPLIVSLLYGQYAVSFRYAVVIMILILLSFLTRRIKKPDIIQTNEALTVVMLAFLVSPLLMTYPMMGTGLSFEDALFETVSAVTTTGLSVLPTVEDKPEVFLFARAWIQWYGGLGIVVLSLALVFSPDSLTRRLADTQFEKKDLVENTHMYAQKIIIIYLFLTACGFLCLVIAGVDWLNSLVHTFAAISTGGFSSFDQSLAGFSHWSTRAIIVIISLTGAVPFALYYKAKLKNMSVFFRDPEVKGLFLALTLITSLLILTMHYYSNFSWDKSMSHAFLMGISAQSTAGFSSFDLSELDNVSKITMILAMAIGGGTGSTAGGIKLFKIIILIKVIELFLIRLQVSKHAVIKLRINGVPIQPDEIESSLVFIFLFTGIIIFSWIPFIACGYEPLNALFDVVSAMATVGLSSGVTSHELPTILKMILCFDMLAGRVEIIALLVFLYPRNWYHIRR
jgi:trk system potassium uptake protein TrkH